MPNEDVTKEAKQDVFEKEANASTTKQSYLVSNIIIICALIIVAGAWTFSYKMTHFSGQILVSSEGDFQVTAPEDWKTVITEPIEMFNIYSVSAESENRDASAFVLAVPNDNAFGDVNTAADNIALAYEQFGFEFITREETEINGVEGVFYEATLADAIGTYYQAGFLAIENDIRYSVIAQGTTETFEEDPKLYKNIVESFKIIQ